MPDPSKCFMRVVPRVSNPSLCVARLPDHLIENRQSRSRKFAGCRNNTSLRHRTCRLFRISGGSGPCSTPALAPPIARPPHSVFSGRGTLVRVTPALVVARNSPQNSGAESSTSCHVTFDLDLMQRDGGGQARAAGKLGYGSCRLTSFEG